MIFELAEYKFGPGLDRPPLFSQRMCWHPKLDWGTAVRIFGDYYLRFYE